MGKLTGEQIMDGIAEMTVLEVSELGKALEDKFGVTAAAPVAAVAAAPAAGESAEEEEQTEFTVILKSLADGKKIPVIKEVRALSGLGLKEAKELVETGDKPVKEMVSKEEADKAKEQLEAAGGVVELKSPHLSQSIDKQTNNASHPRPTWLS